jgi:hypothetical protein
VFARRLHTKKECGGIANISKDENRMDKNRGDRKYYPSL